MNYITLALKVRDESRAFIATFGGLLIAGLLVYLFI
jgi:hypothetical protein